ncbi:hypothetical protein [Aliikangiella sp. IMCC44359]|uniref:hypothetical protein n=1 Tax=Aliikangiella sp. IMCC44359 TaxID=3459125 RepID=UPI00403B2CA2
MMNIFTDYDEELFFKFTLSPEKGLAEVEWLEHDEFPPLSPRKAIACSKLALENMLAKFRVAEDARFGECALSCTNDMWYYIVTWFVWPQEPGDMSSIRVPVYLNGQVPSYEVFDYQSRAEAWKT